MFFSHECFDIWSKGTYRWSKFYRLFCHQSYHQFLQTIPKLSLYLHFSCIKGSLRIQGVDVVWLTPNDVFPKKNRALRGFFIYPLSEYYFSYLERLTGAPSCNHLSTSCTSAGVSIPATSRNLMVSIT